MALARISVIGAGLMGHGIAQVFAVAGHAVKITDTFPQTLETVHERIRRNLREMSLDPAAAERVECVADFASVLQDAEAVFEAAPENMELKQKLFAEIERHAPESAILASNTSVMPITEIMKNLRDKTRALGTHWWNPPFLVPLVEVIRTKDTSDAAVAAMIAMLKNAGKTAVEVKKDVPGFVGNRLQHALWREAISIVEQGICDAETVDMVVKASFGRRLPVLGPLENADMIGTDLTLAIHQQVLPHVDATRGPSPYLEKLVADNKIGFKTGEGFRKWTAESGDALRKTVAAHLIEMDKRKT